MACLLRTLFLHFSSSMCITLCALFSSFLAVFTAPANYTHTERDKRKTRIMFAEQFSTTRCGVCNQRKAQGWRNRTPYLSLLLAEVIEGLQLRVLVYRAGQQSLLKSLNFLQHNISNLSPNSGPLSLSLSLSLSLALLPGLPF